MIRWLWLSFSLLILTTDIQAKGIKAVVSHTIFYLPDSGKGQATPYIETYWEIEPVSIHYTKADESHYIGKFKTDVVFTNEHNDTVKQDHDVLQTRPNTNANEIRAQTIIDLRRYTLPAGKTTMRLFLTDLVDTSNRFSFTDTFTIKPPQPNPYYSDIELLDTSYASTTTNIFQKNNLQQIPLCANFYDEKKSILHYYVELYNSQLVSKDELPLIQHVSISRKENEGAIDKLQQTDTLVGNYIQPVMGNINIASLGSGNYYINVVLVSSLHKIVASRSLFFQRFNSNPVKETTDTANTKTKTLAEIEDVNVLDLNKTFVAKFTYTQVRAILRMLIPISDPADVQNIRGFLKKPEETYMRYFIYNHFNYLNKQDPEGEWKKYADKVREVNKLFGSASAPGYETDRGTTYLRYGKPDERIVVENESGTYPYEIWQYNTLFQNVTGKTMSNAVFLFYRPADEANNFVLLHSTVPGETQNISWRSYLYVHGNTNSDNLNARAEQYLPQAVGR